jgi:hypothetical protein
LSWPNHVFSYIDFVPLYSHLYKFCSFIFLTSRVFVAFSRMHGLTAFTNGSARHGRFCLAVSSPSTAFPIWKAGGGGLSPTVGPRHYHKWQMVIPSSRNGKDHTFRYSSNGHYHFIDGKDHGTTINGRWSFPVHEMGKTTPSVYGSSGHSDMVVMAVAYD